MRMRAATIVDHCHVLLALWDGEDSHKQGGTLSHKWRMRSAKGDRCIRVWDEAQKRLQSRSTDLLKSEGPAEIQRGTAKQVVYEVASHDFA